MRSPWRGFWCMATIISLCAVHCRTERLQSRSFDTGRSFRSEPQHHLCLTDGTSSRESSARTWNGQWSCQETVRYRPQLPNCWESCPSGESRSITQGSALGETFSVTDRLGAQKRSKISLRSSAISQGSRRSMSLRCNMYKGLPSRNRAMDGDEGGYVDRRERKCATAASSPPANTVATLEGRTGFWSARPIAGRARPAAHPQMEFTTMSTVPLFGPTSWSTSSGVRASSTPY